MKSWKSLTVLVILTVVISSLLWIPGCGGSPATTTPPETTTPASTTTPSGTTPTAATEFQWPQIVYLSASGSSGMAKYVSWTSLMENDTGMKLRVIPEENSVSRAALIASGKMFMASGGKRQIINELEALEEHAVRNGGPFDIRAVWVHSLANSGMFVRGDSDIYTMDDIKPGIRWSVWAETYSVLKVPKAILDWVQVPHDEVIFVNSGSYDGAVRAVMDGRADIFWGFPTSPVIYEAAAAPHGIRYISMNSEEDPEGAARFRAIDPLYQFGPIGEGVPEARGVWGTQGYTMEFSSDAYDAEFVYHFDRWLDDNFDRYVGAYDSNRFMSYDYLMKSLEITYLPFHDGLIKFLKGKGVWGPLQDQRQELNLKKVNIWVEAYQEALKMADEQGIKVDPTNDDWINLWLKYQVDNNLPHFLLYNDWEDTSWYGPVQVTR